MIATSACRLVALRGPCSRVWRRAPDNRIGPQNLVPGLVARHPPRAPLRPSNAMSGSSASGGSSSNENDGLGSKFEQSAPSASTLRDVLLPVLDSYQRALREHPVATKAVTSLVGFAIGDRIAQSIGSSTSFDVLRFVRMSLYGVMIDGPVGHYFYQFLDTKIYPNDPKCTQAVLAKTAIDQCIWAPIMTCVFLAFLTTLEGHPDVGMISSVIQAKLVPIMLANFTVWPLAHLVNFRFVPPEQRILFNNVVAIAWTTYLSYTCGAVAGGGGAELAGAAAVAGTPRDVLTLAAGLPCVAATADVLSHASPQTLEVVRETSAMNDIAVAWGVDGLKGGHELTGMNGGTEVLLQYFKLKNEALSLVCRP